MNINEVTIPRDEYLRLIKIEEDQEIDRVHERICSNCYIYRTTQKYIDDKDHEARKYRMCLKSVMALVGPYTFGEKFEEKKATPEGHAEIAIAKRVKDIIDNAIGKGELFK